ncbi:beta-alanyl-dopamine/carcinine hydrolase [Microplitis mediator]|uniref:beta-alanyl-dopamine/carcinine hydrolase n=1 Tax=Microplitis mediator TaxID=375433 RepID=UPI002555B900|nr:beta-alanyl-dopamine/carcinine hydrolase [Microplitis mediator]
MAKIINADNDSCEFKKDIGRRSAVPIIYTRGTHYEIGFDIGRTFAKIINEFVDCYKPLNDTYLAAYNTKEGRIIYDETLECVRKQFPQYLREIEGTAAGANVPFYKLFLMHLDDIIPNVINGEMASTKQPVGCSSIICNHPGQEILGHNEDALSETLNYWYIVCADIVEPGYKKEKFSSLSYAGFLPGYTMGFNYHGLVFSINTLSAKTLRSGKTPRYFLARALLGVENFVQAQQTLRNKGYGAAEGFSVNMTFLEQEGDRMFHNAEVGPVEKGSDESQLSILTASPGENIFHCNKYLRLKVPEVDGVIIPSSEHRMSAILRHPRPRTRREVIDILTDQTDNEYRVYQEFGPDDYVKTIATGIFDCVKRTWSIYATKPKYNEPLVVLPIRTETF